MELLMKNIHMCRLTKQGGTQITLDEDRNVPDARPDVEMIIQTREHVVLEHTRAEAGKLLVDGFMEVGILYMDDTKERQICRLDTKLPFDEVISIDDLEPGENVRVRYETEDLNVALINSRKLAIRALVSFEASVEEIYDLSAAVGTRSDLELCEKKESFEFLQLEVQNRDILRIKEEVQLPANKPNIREILWDNVRICGCRTHFSEGRITIQGSLFLFVLYRAEDEGESLQWTEQTVPLEGEIACSGCSPSPEMVPDIELRLSGADLTAKEDTDGESRIFHLDGILDLDIRLYRTETVEILSDIYSPQKNLEIVASEEICEALVVRNESKCKLQGKIRIQSAKPHILQICHSDGSVKIDKTGIMPGGIKIEGALPVSILYISSDDTMPFALLEGTVPFSHVAEAQEIDSDCRFSVTSSLEQLSATMSDSEEIEIRASIGLNLFAVRQGKTRCIHEVLEKEYELETLEAVPGITGYIVQEGETLLDIAKEYFQTPQQIAEMNALESEQVKKGECLILMKNVNPSGTAY